jgi:glucans biosynthesis protein
MRHIAKCEIYLDTDLQKESVGDVVTVVEYKFQRRDVLKLAMGGAAAGTIGACPAWADDAPPPPPVPVPPAATPVVGPAPDFSAVGGPGVVLAAPVPFGPGSVTDLARALSKKPYKAPSQDLPDPFKTLSFEQYSAIHARPEARAWSTETTGFALEPLHRGFLYANPVELNLVSQGQAYRLVYDTKLFDFGALHPGPKTGDIGFSGFRVLVPQNKTDFTEIASFQGANFFRALTGGQVPGLVSRALAVRLADPKGEDVPVFRTMWIEKPSLVTNALVVHAVIDSETITGAFRFTIHPGEATIIDTECTLFARVAVDNIGLGTMSATHLLGFMDHRKFDDLRPNVSEVCGLQMYTGAGEWLWRPVANRDTLQISTFIDEKPRGFGFMLRDRSFDDYADEDQHWEKRPSLWIEPLGEWGQGGVQLIEIPSESEGNDNILCFWRPKQPLAAGSETAFAYRQFWCWDPPEKPDLARTATSRSGHGVGKRRRFFVDFQGDILADAARTIGLKPTLTSVGGTITQVRAYPADDRKSVRVFFEMDPGSDQSSELRLVLEAQGKAVSETWLYRWTPS